MKIKAVCRKDKNNKNGRSPLFLRFTDQRNTKFSSIGLSVEPRYWDFDAQMLTADCPDRRTLQSQIDSMLETYSKKIRRLEWRLVTPWLADLLRGEGETVIAEYDCHWWGRTQSGQAIHMDSVIERICRRFG